MQALRARNARKGLLLVLVVVGHGLVIGLLVFEMRSLSLPGADTVSVTALLMLPVRRSPTRWLSPPVRALSAPVRPLVAPITLSLAALPPPIRVTRAINWSRAARQAVHAVLRRRRRIAFGFPAGARHRAELRSAASGVRSQGRESYRTRTGQHIYRSGGNCYLVSGPPPLDASQLERQAQLSRVECAGARRGPSPDNLFKNLPAYRRYHALPPSAVHPRRRPAPPDH